MESDGRCIGNAFVSRNAKFRVFPKGEGILVEREYASARSKVVIDSRNVVLSKLRRGIDDIHMIPGRRTNYLYIIFINILICYVLFLNIILYYSSSQRIACEIP